MKKIVVGIVLYNSKISMVERVIAKLSSVASGIVLVDNNSGNVKEVEELRSEKVTLIENKKNLGVAKALNEILEYANKMGADCVLTLDQDSVLEAKDVEEMIKYVSDDVAIVCPMMVDINKDEQKKYRHKVDFVDRCITSGSLMNLKTCNKVGKFDDSMFIDYVDFEYCKRIRLAGYKIVRLNYIKLVHEIGKRTNRRFLWIKVYPTNHNPRRIYFYVRNIYYYLWKFRKELTFKERVKERILLFWKYLSIILYEDNKGEKLKSYREGKRDGKNGLRMVEYADF
ncbi:glycosyltransferase family 2 protein [Candidatus Saccharibacteria bacterium]|nr:glycosyltransferase family 2 protein [Candidatus Saccharibacteria bacterium]